MLESEASNQVSHKECFVAATKPLCRRSASTTIFNFWLVQLAPVWLSLVSVCGSPHLIFRTNGDAAKFSVACHRDGIQSGTTRRS